MNCRSASIPILVEDLEDRGGCTLATITITGKDNVKIVNLTPHTVTCGGPGRWDMTTDIEPSGQVARMRMTTHKVGTINGIPLVTSKAGTVVDLPPPEDGTYYLVSTLVRLAPVNARRLDLVSPTELVRDDKGQITGCRALERNPD
jgi:hypothetical protein